MSKKNANTLNQLGLFSKNINCTCHFKTSKEECSSMIQQQLCIVQCISLHALYLQHRLQLMIICHAIATKHDAGIKFSSRIMHYFLEIFALFAAVALLQRLNTLKTHEKHQCTNHIRKLLRAHLLRIYSMHCAANPLKVIALKA